MLHVFNKILIVVQVDQVSYLYHKKDNNSSLVPK